MKALGEYPGYTGWDMRLRRVAKQKVVLEVKAILHLDV